MNDLKGRARVDRRPPAAHDNRAPLMVVAVATGTALFVLGFFFWSLATREAAPELGAVPPVAAPAPEAAPAPDAAAPAPEAEQPPPTPEPPPPAPQTNQLASDGWQLSPYSVRRLDGNLFVSGTLNNQSGQDRSTRVSVQVYVDGAPVAAGSAEVRDVDAGGSAKVEIATGSPFVAGEKILVLSTAPLS